MQSPQHQHGFYGYPAFQALTYRHALRYIASFINYEKKSGFSYRHSMKLDRARDFLAFCGNPQHSFPSVHVAGTKGKGSVCAFLASILRHSGYTTGLYTSPHLHDLRERVRVLIPGTRRHPRAEFDGMISRRAFAGAVGVLRDLISRYRAGPCPHGELTFFEVITALAFLYFKKRRVDCAVLETGMGGRLDATNTVDPLVCVITPISLDHMNTLGNTLRAIAREKAGIIKKSSGRVSVVCSAQGKEARAVIRARCVETRALLAAPARVSRINRRAGSFDVSTGGRTYTGLRIRLLGIHQLSNAATAVAAAEELRLRGFRISPASVRKGLESAVWPARCEIIGRHPLTVIDGCQNRASALALRRVVKEAFRFNRLILVFGMSCDKDLKGTASALSPIADTVVLTKAAHPRACDTLRLAPFFKKGTVIYTRSVSEARREALRVARDKDLILVCGSLFVVSEFKYGKHTCS